MASSSWKGVKAKSEAWNFLSLKSSILYCRPAQERAITGPGGSKSVPFWRLERHRAAFWNLTLYAASRVGTKNACGEVVRSSTSLFTSLASSAALSLFLFALPAKAYENGKTWVAVLTGRVQCESYDQKGFQLGRAISNLEAQLLTVHRAQIGRLNDRLFCTACGCPDGTFYIAQVRGYDEAVGLEADWFVIDPALILGNEARRKSELPISPAKVGI